MTTEPAAAKAVRFLEIGDGIATVYGLDRVVYGELVEFETGARGIARTWNATA